MKWRLAAAVMLVGLWGAVARGGNADLVISELTGPSSASAGEMIVVTNTVENTRNQPALGDFTVGIYLFDTDRAVVLGTDVPETTWVVSGGLPPMGTASDNTALTLPDPLASGVWYVVAYADCLETVGEANETNNQTSWAIGIDMPDLVVTSVSGPTIAEADGTVSVDVTVENQGASSAGVFSVGICLSDNTTIDLTDAFATEEWLVSGGLAAGATDSQSVQVTIDALTTAGAYYLGAYADYGEAILEGDETNNGLADTNGITIVDEPDFTMSVSGDTAAAAGGTITVTNTVTNEGATDTTDFTVGIYIFDTDRAVVLGTDVAEVTRTVTGGLGLLGTSSDDTQVTLPDPMPAGPGAYFVVVYADIGTAVAESREGNNGASYQINVDIADLVVTAVSGPSISEPGGTVTVSSTVRNDGEATLLAFSVGVYLSADTAIDLADTLLGEWPVAGLASGATASDSSDYTVPGGTAAGTWYIGAYVDRLDEVPTEASEANNGLADTNGISIVDTPDLTVTSVSGPTDTLLGGTITVADTVTNEGATDATDFTVGIYIFNTDRAVVLGTDTAEATRTVTGGLALLGTSSGSTDVTIPDTLPTGTCYVVVYADTADVVDETPNEANNQASYAITVDAPDLVVSSVTGDTSASAGGTITVSNTVTNEGASDTTDFTVGIYVFDTDRNVVLGTDVAEVTRTVTGGLDLLGVSSEDTQVTVPASLTPGPYFVVVHADTGQDVAESREGNNGASYQINVDIADLVVTAVSGPSISEPGGTVTVSSTVRNDGVATGTTFSVGVYLSADTAIDLADTLLGEWPVAGLASGATASDSSDYVIDALTTAGTWYIGAYVDRLDDVPTEASETNNASAPADVVTITIVDTPDLTVTMIRPADSWPGGTVTVTNTVTNEGATDTTDFTVGIYIFDTNRSVVLGADAAEATRTVTGGLALQETSSSNTQVTIPDTLTAGTWFVVVYADTGDVVGELDEANNEVSRQIIIAAEAPVTPVTPLGGGCSAAGGGAAWGAIALPFAFALLLFAGRRRRLRTSGSVALLALAPALLVATGCACGGAASVDVPFGTGAEPVALHPDAARVVSALPAFMPGDTRRSGLGARVGVVAPAAAQDADYLPGAVLGAFYPGRLPGFLGLPAIPFEAGLDLTRIDTSSGDVNANVVLARFDCLFSFTRWKAGMGRPELYALAGLQYVGVSAEIEGSGTAWENGSAFDLGVGLAWPDKGLDVRMTYASLMGSGNLGGLVLVTGGYSF